MIRREHTSLDGETPPWVRDAKWGGRVVALDPGLAHFGLVAVQTDGDRHLGLGYEVFTTESYTRKYEHAAMGDLMRRARLVDRWFGGQLDKYKPHVVAAEEYSQPPDARAAVMLAWAWGLVTSQLEARRIPIVCGRPKEWRDALIGRETRPAPKGKAARRARVVERENRSHAEAGRRVPGVYRAIRATVSRALQEHALDALGVFCWSVDTDVVRGVVRGVVRRG